VIPRLNIRILCVDDNAAITAMLATLLEGAGYHTDTAPNGVRALDLISRDPSRYPLVITDIRMPGMDGYQLISDARAVGYGGGFVVLASMLSSEDRTRLRDLGVRSVIDKPSSRAEILGAVTSTLAGY
jgi:CheY-like chemotaxis protein